MSKTERRLIERFLDLLIKATERVPPHYFQLPTAGSLEAVYRERVYSYELYHQLRILLDEGPEAVGNHYALSGEIDKACHQIIRERRAPDLVFHIPGEMRNLVVVEIKPVSAQPKGINKDIVSLRYFLSKEIGYQRGVHLAYGDSEKQFRRFEQKHRETGDCRLVLLWHKRAGEAAIRVPIP